MRSPRRSLFILLAALGLAGLVAFGPVAAVDAQPDDEDGVLIPPDDPPEDPPEGPDDLADCGSLMPDDQPADCGPDDDTPPECDDPEVCDEEEGDPDDPSSDGQAHPARAVPVSPSFTG
jgi:hypothetical protein